MAWTSLLQGTDEKGKDVSKVNVQAWLGFNIFLLASNIILDFMWEAWYRPRM